MTDLEPRTPRAMKDLLVHLNVSKHCRERVEVASLLVRTFGGRLTGLFASPRIDMPFYMMEEVTTNDEATMHALWLRARDKVKAEFDDLLHRAGISGNWVEADDRDGSAASRHARYADLTVVGQLDPDEPLPRSEYRVPELVVLDSGGPVLMVPYAGTIKKLGQRVLVAWNDSAQSARAVRDALPLLMRAEAVTILTVNPENLSKGKNDLSTAQIAAHLACHGVTAKMLEVVAEDRAVGEMILSQAASESADLIIMGAYGHARAREIVFGGVTRTIFETMTVPTFMSH